MCYRPITIKNPATGDYMQVPCGKCLDCKRKYQNALSNRMWEEFKSKGFKGVFFTLTYDENHVPKNYLVDGQIFRSNPDYGFSNVHLDKFNREVCEFRARKKYAEFPHSVIRDFLGERTFDEIEDFNKIKFSKERQEWFSKMEDLFVKEMALSAPVADNDCQEPIGVSDLSQIEVNLDSETFDFPTSNFYDIDEETGELISKSPDVDLKEIEDLKTWYNENTPIVSFNSVRKEDIQLWLKRCRSRSKRNGEVDCFSYFITSEYGPRTLRPHYHGVLFGVTKDDVKVWFEDWQKHYGEIVRFDNLDANKGGLSYVAKYCSKGVFEHPLCSKDFFYFYRRVNEYSQVVCNEYHSKHFEKCIQWFGIDAPLVDCTFHLFSKGLGVDWCKPENNNLRCEEFEEVTRSYKPHFDFGSYSIIIHDRNQPDVLLSGDFDIEDLAFKAKAYEFTKSPDAWLRRFVLCAKYTRVFRSKNKQTGEIQEKCFAFAIPRYYRQKIFGRNLSIAYPAFVRSENERMYREKFQSMEACQPSRTDTEIALAIEAEDRQRIVDMFNSCFEKQSKFYHKSKV